MSIPDLSLSAPLLTAPLLTAAQLSAVLSVPRPIVLIDGRSGSGKTTFAHWLAPRLRAQLVHLEDIYPGWDGLQAASDHLHDFVLAARPRWQSWNWDADGPGEWHELDARRPLVIEGAGALSAVNRALATHGIWIERDAATRKQRAITRDGDRYAPHWERWARQEERFEQAEHPRSLADFELAG